MVLENFQNTKQKTNKIVEKKTKIVERIIVEKKIKIVEKQNQNSGNQNSGKRNNLVGKKNKIVAKNGILNQPKYYCESCDYNCFKKYNWTKHLATDKHKNASMEIKSLATEIKESPITLSML